MPKGDGGKRLTEDDMFKIVKDVQGPNRLHPGSVWEHSKSGKMYTVDSLTLLEADMSVYVVYSRMRDKTPTSDGWRPTFARPHKEFVEKFVLRRI